MNMHVVTPTVKRPPSLTLAVIDNEPRVLDTALAVQLGLSQPEDIRRTIQANREELEAFGIIAERAINTGKRGRPGKAFYLNRPQALFICILSRTEKAKEVRAEVIRVFMAYEKLTKVPEVPVLQNDLPWQFGY